MSQPYNTDDVTEERLAGYFEEIYQFLAQQHVPDDRLPSPWHILSHIIQHVDYDTFRGWLDEYVAREAEPPYDDDGDEEEEEDAAASRARGRIRYLRPLSGTVDDGQEEEDGS